MQDEDCQKNLIKILYELSKDQMILQGKMEQYAGSLCEVYSDVNFRHMYSMLFATITDIDQSNNGSLDILLENIKLLKKHIDESEKIPPNVRKSVKKLYDHVSLDIARINYIRGLNQKAENLEITLKDVEKQSVEAHEKVRKIQRESVTILGIFVSIAAALFSSIGFSSSVLSNMGQVSIYRLSFVVLLLAGILFNALALLMDFVRDMTSVDYSMSRKTVKWFNISICLLFLLNGICWLCDIVSVRSYLIGKCIEVIIRATQ